MRGSSLAIAIAASTLLLPGHALAEEFWIDTEGSGCQVWSDEPALEDDFLAWSGECDSDNRANGFGLAIWLRGGELYARYSGEMIAGRLHGTDGLLLMQSESEDGLDVVYGSFADGVLDGPATIMGADGSLFQGNYSQGKKNGEGLLVDRAGNSFQGLFVDDAVNGPGRSVAADGETYEGTFRDNNRHGNGVLLTKDGQIYSGEFEDDMFSGEGRIEGPDGYFEGTFSENRPNGTGKLVAEDGTITQGNFVDGKPSGLVLITKPDGSQITETWKDGKKIDE